MRKKLILPILILLLFTMSISVSALDIKQPGSVKITTEVLFDVDGAISTNPYYAVFNDMLSINGINKYKYVVEDGKFDINKLPDATKDFKLSKPGYRFVKWELTENDLLEIIEEDNVSLSHLIVDKKTVTITVKAIWKENNYNLVYNINQGVIENNDKYTYNKKGTIVFSETSKAFTQKVGYSKTLKNGLANAETFGVTRDGYLFAGWSTNKDGTNLFSEDDKKVSPQKLLEKAKNKDVSKITLYAQWLPEKVSIVYMNDEKATIGNWKYEEKDGFLKNKFSINIISQKFKTNSNFKIKAMDNVFELSQEYGKFAGWSTKPNGKGIVLKPGQTITNSIVVPYINNHTKILRLYPVWDEYIIPLDTSDGVYISSLQGGRIHPIHKEYRYHAGMDIAACNGTPIYATAKGVVTQVGVDTGVGYGNYVKIQHKDGVETLYAHASKTLVEVGDEVAQGDTIALVGTTGTSTGNHLHFEMIINGDLVDPMEYVDFSGICIDI